MAFASMLSLAATSDSNSLGDATPLTKDTLISALTSDLAAHFSLEGELHVELSHNWLPPEHVARDWRIELSDYPMVASASMLLHCRILADGTVASESLVAVHAELWRDVWVVRQPLNSGSTFDRTMLDSRRADAFRERDAVPSSVGDPSFIFLRGVQAGHCLTWHDIGRRPLVRKGDLVDVTASEGALSISMKALAMQNGAQGEAVTVRNIDSHKDFTAIVVDENHVQIRF